MMIIHHRLNEYEDINTQTLCGVRYNPVTSRSHASFYYKHVEDLDAAVAEWVGDESLPSVPLISLKVCLVCKGNPKLDLAILADTEL